MTFKILEHDSEDYKNMIKLRMKVLLNPIGIQESYINKEKEKEDLLIGIFENEKLIGCCILSPLDNDQIQLRQMAIDYEHQGKNLGRDLILYAEKTAKEKQFNKLIIHARNPVVDFYKKCGYKIFGEEFFEVGIGHHKLEKYLD